MKGTKKLRNGSTVRVLDIIGKHEFRVLMTRANNGLFIYACDPDLRVALKSKVVKI